MTKEEFLKRFSKGTRVRCETREERNSTLIFFRDNGYKINKASLGYLDNDTDGFKYKCPAFEGGVVCCYTYHGLNYIPFADVADIIMGECNFTLQPLSTLLM